MITQYRLISEVIFIISLGVGVVWFIHYERQIGYDKAVAEYNKDRIKQEEIARKREQDLTDQLNQAKDEATQREQIIVTLSNNSRASSDSLSAALDKIRTDMPSYSQTALTEHTAALTAILGECQRDYRQMAENADRHYSDYKTLSEAWPK